MLSFVLKRLAYCVLVVIGVSLISFIIIHLAPGDPARLMLPDGASDEDVHAMRVKIGLDRPLATQYLSYMERALQGDFGKSIYYNQPNIKIIFEVLPATILLTFSSMLLALLISIPLGIISGVKRGSMVDVGSMFFALLGQSMSPVLLGILLIYVLSVSLRLLPPFGYGSPLNLIMPSITLGTPLAALITRMTRAGMINVLSEDYITATLAKGIPWNKVVNKYALKNVLIPIVTIVGLQVGTFLGGAIVTEQIFSWPGVGRLIVSSIFRRDFPMVQCSMLIVSSMFVFINLIVDILYMFVDPRMNLARGSARSIRFKRAK
jgi:peptide/nickel transport system permease protein